ncbi:MAG: hypothetical protein HYV09_29275 [Deltaproteobacteria bacterium]|nr:hypothetical protein [Deltaproteobacteria bacterium]
MRSLREAWGRAYKALGAISGGLYQGLYGSEPESFPFRSIRRLIDASRWPEARLAPVQIGVRPQGLRYIGKHPELLVANWTHQANGLAHDENYWYSTQTFAISRIPRSVPLAEAKDDVVQSDYLVNASGETAKHAGALAYYQGYLYVPVEGHGWPGLPGDHAQIWVVDPTTFPKPKVVETILMEAGQKKAPWCAINSDASLLYTSDFIEREADPLTANQIRIYRLWPWPHEPGPGGARLKRVGTLSLTTESGDPFPARQMQGGLITPNNHLLLVCDEPLGEAVSGMHLFDLVTGVRRWHTRWIDVDSTYPGYGLLHRAKRDEAQSVAVWSIEGFFVHTLFTVKTSSGPDGVMVLRWDTWNSWERDSL